MSLAGCLSVGAIVKWYATLLTASAVDVVSLAVAGPAIDPSKRRRAQFQVLLSLLLSLSSPFPSLALSLSLSRPLSHRVIYLLANAIWHHLRVQRRQRQQHSPTVLSAQHSTAQKIDRRTGGKKV